MRLALDINTYSAFQRGNNTQLKSLVDTAEFIAMPFIVDAELKAGFKKGTKEKDNDAKLHKFQAFDKVLVLWPDETTNEIYARIWAELVAKGKLIPTNDIWIAAICLQHNLALATSDTHFAHIPLLRTIPF